MIGSRFFLVRDSWLRGGAAQLRVAADGACAPPLNARSLDGQTMRVYAETIGVIGVIFLNVVFLSIRLFARDHGLKVRWWSRSFAPERHHLRMLARLEDLGVARRARFYLRLEILAWVSFFPLAAMFFWGVTAR